MFGAEAARRFYEPDRFSRRRGMPSTTFTLIQDMGSVMVLDGPAHRVRKAMFLSMMRPSAIDRLAELMEDSWRARAEAWVRRDRTVLLPEVECVLCDAILRWAGLQLPEATVDRLAGRFVAMIDGTGSIGPRNWVGHRTRGMVERFVRALMRDIRSGVVALGADSPAATVSNHRDADGALLDVAVVELINLLRATVANGRYVVFPALTLHAYPDARRWVEGGDPAAILAFVHEGRRLYSFIPAIGGHVLRPFE